MNSRHDFKAIIDKYDPLKVGSIDGSDHVPHDKAIIRALNSEYKVNSRVVGDPLNTVFVSRLDSLTNEEQLKEIFSKHGKIKQLRLVRDIITGHSKRYAFIEFIKRKHATRAVEKAHNILIDGRKIFVDFECERTMPDWKPRRLGGGFGGNRNSGQLRFGCKDRPFKRPIFVPEKRNEHKGRQDFSIRNHDSRRFEQKRRHK